MDGKALFANHEMSSCETSPSESFQEDDLRMF